MKLSTDWLPDTFSQGYRIVFRCSTLLQPKKCLLTYCNTYNAFMDLPVSSFMSHSSFLTAKSIDIVVSTWWLPFIMEIVHVFYSAYFDYRGTFVGLFLQLQQISSWHDALASVKSVQIGANPFSDSFQLEILINEVAAKREFPNWFWYA